MEKRNDRLVKIAEAPNEPVALMWKEALERAGIDAMVKAAGPGAGYFSPAVLPQFLYVLSEDEERAREILESIAEDDEEPA